MASFFLTLSMQTVYSPNADLYFHEQLTITEEKIKWKAFLSKDTVFYFY